MLSLPSYTGWSAKHFLPISLLLFVNNSPVEMTTVMDDVRKVPPVTRFLCGALVTITLSIKLEAVSLRSVIFMLKEGTIGGQVS